MNVLGIIPSRYGSTRFPGKPLVEISGKSMINRVFDQARKSGLLTKVIVATDDNKIYDHVKGFGGNVLMTDKKHNNGTSRCLEVMTLLENFGQKFDAVVNIQGDEPFINPHQIDSIVNILTKPNAQIATLAKKITSSEELFNPNVVKIVMSKDKQALYFSRQAIPFNRSIENNLWIENADYFKHIGLYGYKTSVLKKVGVLDEGVLENTEKLEQLRWLENGLRIDVEITEFESIAIDTPEDLLKLETNV